MSIGLIHRYDIEIVGISSDGDARLVTSMKLSLTAMFNQMSHDVINNMNREQPITFVQDTIHLATKLRNRLLKYSILLPMGSKQVSVTHLKILISTVPKETHGLSASDISADDRQNFDSFEKISSDRVLDALKKYVIDSEATITYLKLCRDITEAYTKVNLSPLDRVLKLWNALYFFRIWRKWIRSHENSDRVKYQVPDNYISDNAFTCLEINAYSLLHLITKLRDTEQSHLFLVSIFDSQGCERIFRQFRSMTTANWTKINFTMLELLHIISRIELQNDIAYFKLQNVVKFPRIHYQSEKHEVFQLPTNDQLRDVMKQALETAEKTASRFDMKINTDEVLLCEISKRPLQRRGNIKGKENSVPEELSNPIEKIDCTNFKQFPDEDCDLDYRFIQVCDNDGTIKVLRKQQLVWAITEKAEGLSKDRLERVKAPKDSVSKSSKRKKWNQLAVQQSKIQRLSFERLKEIQIGHWCVFRNNIHIGDADESYAELGLLKDLVVGTILGFKYLEGKNEKEKQYSLDAAPVFHDSPNKRGVEVLALWYGLKSDLTLLPLATPSYFINIENYVANAPKVTRNDETNSYMFSVNSDQLKKDLLTLTEQSAEQQ